MRLALVAAAMLRFAGLLAARLLMLVAATTFAVDSCGFNLAAARAARLSIAFGWGRGRFGHRHWTDRVFGHGFAFLFPFLADWFSNLLAHSSQRRRIPGAMRGTCVMPMTLVLSCAVPVPAALEDSYR
jgi:hypothetical protein